MPKACIRRSALPLFFLISLIAPMTAMAQFFSPGNVVVVVEGCGVQGSTCTVTGGTGTGAGNSTTGGYGDNQAAPLTLFQFAPTGTTSASYVNSLVIPQTASGANLAVAGEYGSSSEGGIQLSGDGRYLTLMGYGVNAAAFDADPTAYGAAPSLALGQSGSLTGQSYTPVPRVVALIDANGNVNTATGIYNVFDTNNPRSIYTTDGVNAYISGQGSGSDATGGVFYTPLGTVNNAPTAITGLDTTSNTLSQDTRMIQIYNGTLYVSVDTKGGSGATRDFIGTLGNPPATSLFDSSNGPTQLLMSNNASTPVAVSSNGKLTLTASETNGINATGKQINLSPSGFFFANAYTMYVADTGNSKQTSASNSKGDGGLQKWVNTSPDGTGTWVLQYTLSAGLNLVVNSSASGTSGLYSVTGIVNGPNVDLYVTNATLSDLDPTYLYGITDTIATTTPPGTSFTQLAAAPADSNFKGVSIAPTFPAGSATLTTVPSGLSITTAGTGCAPGTYTTPVTLVWTPGSACTLTTTTPQTSASTPYVFSKWQDGTTSTTDTVTAPSISATYTATFTNTYQPVGALEKAVDNSTTSTSVNLGDSLLVSGWAADPVDGSPLTDVKVYVDGNLFGAPTLGISRPDIATTYSNSNYTNSGYQLISSTSALTLGPHAVTVVAIDSASHATTLGPLSINILATPTLVISSSSIAMGTTSTTLTATVAYTGSVAPTGAVIFTVNGSATGVGAVTCTGSTSPLTCTASYTSSSLAVGSYTVTASLAATSSYTAATSSGTLTVTALPMPTITVASNSVVLAAASTTLSATITYTGSVAPTGAVTFIVNGSATGVGAVSCTGTASPITCTATYATSSLAAGTYPVVVSEAATSGFYAATGSGSLTVTAAPDFSFTNQGTSNQNVTRGNSATYTFSLKPTASSFPGVVSFSVSGLPTGATSTLTPSSVAATGSAQTVTLTVQTSQNISSNTVPGSPLTRVAFAGLCLLPICLRRKLRSRIIRPLVLLLFVCGSLGGFVSLLGCGSSLSQVPVIYTVTVTATSGGQQHQATVGLTLQ